MEKAKVFWLIWSIEHGAWWKPKRCGYTKHIKDAGRYSYQEARQIVWDGNYGQYDTPNETMVQDYIGEQLKVIEK
jgi:hypothetical protein